MKKKYFIFIIVFITILGSIAWGYWKINETAPDTKDLKGVIKIPSNKLTEIIKTNDYELLNYAIGKPISIEGTITEINKDINFTLLLNSPEGVIVSCEFQKDQAINIAEYQIGRFINVIGVYRGALNYLILSNCIVN